MSGQQTLNRLWNKIFSGSFTGGDVHSLGFAFFSLNNNELAAATFNMGADMGHGPSSVMLEKMIAAGRHPYKKASAEDIPKTAS